MECVFGSSENIVGKGETAGIQYYMYLLFMPPHKLIDGGAYSFCPVFCFCMQKLTLAKTFEWYLIRTFMFHMCIPCGMTFSLIPRWRLLVKVKVKYQGHFFQELAVTGALVFYKHNFLFLGMVDFIFHNFMIETVLIIHILQKCSQNC